MSWYYDDDPYTPRIGPAAMPSPRSKYAPYYSGHANTFEDFLEEFEGRAYDCALTDPQRVDVIIRYVAPSLRDFWRSLNGYRSRDWPLFRQSLIKVFGSTTPRPQVMRQRLLSYVQDSSRTRMNCADDVIQYYRQFLCLGEPLVHSGHLTKEDRNAAFWYGFHPEDREDLWPRLLGKNPFQPSDVPFHFEDVFVCARGAFAYGNPFPPWLHEQQFQSSTVRCERSVAKHGSRDTYGLQEMSRAVTSNAETTGNLDELPLPPQSTPHPQFPLSSPSVLESQHGLAHSATLNQPGPAPTLSTTLRPSASSPSHTSSPVHPATDNDLIPAYTFPITTSTLPPSVSPTPSHDSSLAHSAADENPESTFPSPSIMPAPFSIPMSDFEYLPSVTVDQPEPVPTLSSTPPSSSISSTFLLSPARLATEDQSEPEPVPALFASVPTLPFAPSHVRSTADNDSIFTSTPPSSSPTSSTFVPFPVRSAMNNQPESEHEAASTVLLLSLPLSTLHPLSPLSSTSLPSPVTSATDDQPEPESMSMSVISTKLELSPRALPFPPDQKLDLPPRALSPPPDWLLVPSSTLSSSPLQEISSLGSGPLASPSPDQPSSLSESLSQLSRPCELESSTLVSAADVVTLSHLELPLSPGEPVLFLPSSLDAPLNAPISPHPLPSQRPPGPETVGSDSFPFEIAPPIASSVPRRGCQEPSLPHEVQSIKPPALAPGPSLFHSSGSLRRTPASFYFTLALVTAAALASILNISAIVSTFARKFQSKIEDFGNSQNSTPGYKTGDDLTHRLQLGQYTPRDSRLVFDPGGQASSSRLFSAHDDVRKRMPKTRNDFITRRHPYSRSNRQPRFRPQRWSIRVRASRRGLGNV